MSVLRGAGLAVALAAGALWVRSHRVADEFNWPVAPGKGLELIHSRAVFTAPGRVVFNERCAFT